ncbi:Holliday junction resolvase RuvX [bacterium]|nr:Holliday junction resolvase RuvX [bacterium]
MKKTGRVLGLDFGARRIGVAISDPLGITAQPLTTIRNKKATCLSELTQLILEKEVILLVVGLPRHMSGQEGEKALAAREFGERLSQQAKVPVQYIDERLTTVAAQRVLTESGMSGSKQRQAVDKLAAVLILQTWMDRQQRA